MNQDEEMVKAGKSEEEITSSQVNSDVEFLEIENPKELDAPPLEISLHVEGLKLDDDVKKTLASKDDENKDALKDKEELLKEDDDVCEEVKEIEVGKVVLDQPEEKEEVAEKVDKEENVSSWMRRKKRTTSRLFTSPLLAPPPPPPRCTLQASI